MEIVIAAGGMTFGPDTLNYKSLGGSETAVIEVSRELGQMGHRVMVFAPLPPPERPDHVKSGAIRDKVTWCHIDNYLPYVTNVNHDLLIISRDPNLAAHATQSKKKVLWMHDIATRRGMGAAFGEMGFCIDEVWTVSGWHADQVAKGSDYPRDNIFPLRNGVVKVETMALPQVKGQLLYASRPERGLENLIRSDGIMSHLPDHKLLICMYDHFPEHMKEYYAKIHAMIKACPNAEYIGSKTQAELRQIMQESEAYIYPTQFEETSCIIAREAIEQRTPFITTKVGALPETLDDCGIFCESDLEPGSPKWCKTFATFTKLILGDDLLLTALKKRQETRRDLYWDGVAKMMLERAQPVIGKRAARLWSLMQDNDIMAALAFYDTFTDQEKEHPFVFALWKELSDNYPFLSRFGGMSMAEYYKDHYGRKQGTDDDALVFTDKVDTDRIKYIAESIRKVKGGNVIEFGCGAGHLIASVAKQFPEKDFYGVDHAENAIQVVKNAIADSKIVNHNITVFIGDENNWPDHLISADAIICSEVLEHVEKPWALLDFIESKVKPGGKVICSVPFGPWEVRTTHANAEDWSCREHLWHFTQEDIRDMVAHKAGFHLVAIGCGMQLDGRNCGQYVFEYTADHETKAIPIDPLTKALGAFTRQNCAAAVIAFNNEDTIIKMLNSIDRQVQMVQIAHGPSTDRTLELIEHWAAEHPWTRVRIIDVPQIRAADFDDDGKVLPETGFAFDQARNISVELLDEAFDWVLWIDTDEYLVGNFRIYLRENVLDSYLLAQHHFTCEPRGAAVQVDRPARLFRTRSNFVCRGHIHEHFELDDGEGGPGKAILLPNVDIGHTGYENETVRQARFGRNFPFLVWDHQDPESQRRRLHPFLWFRDIIHRMRYAEGEGQPEASLQLAHQAVEYYNEHWEQMSSFGPGLFQAIAYISEAYQRIGKGTGFQIAIQMDDGKNLNFQGQLEDYEQVERVMGQLLKPEFELRQGKYY